MAMPMKLTMSQEFIGAFCRVCIALILTVWHDRECYANDDKVLSKIADATRLRQEQSLDRMVTAELRIKNLFIPDKVRGSMEKMGMRENAPVIVDCVFAHSSEGLLSRFEQRGSYCEVQGVNSEYAFSLNRSQQLLPYSVQFLHLQGTNQDLDARVEKEIRNSNQYVWPEGSFFRRPLNELIYDPQFKCLSVSPEKRSGLRVDFSCDSEKKGQAISAGYFVVSQDPEFRLMEYGQKLSLGSALVETWNRVYLNYEKKELLPLPSEMRYIMNDSPTPNGFESAERVTDYLTFDQVVDPAVFRISYYGLSEPIFGHSVSLVWIGMFAAGLFIFLIWYIKRRYRMSQN
jgi:hypothetical protein